jgi:hypothetical protein
MSPQQSCVKPSRSERSSTTRNLRERSYPSQNKALLFFEVPDLRQAIDTMGKDRFLQREKTWAVLHDPVLIQKSR